MAFSCKSCREEGSEKGLAVSFGVLIILGLVGPCLIVLSGYHLLVKNPESWGYPGILFSIGTVLTFAVWIPLVFAWGLSDHISDIRSGETELFVRESVCSFFILSMLLALGPIIFSMGVYFRSSTQTRPQAPLINGTTAQSDSNVLEDIDETFTWYDDERVRFGNFLIAFGAISTLLIFMATAYVLGPAALRARGWQRVGTEGPYGLHQLRLRARRNRRRPPHRYDVFLSYRRLDEDLAGRVYTALMNVGIRVFYDRECLPAGGFFEELQLAIKNSTIFIPLVTPNYFNVQRMNGDNDYCYQEIATAVAMRRVIIPIVQEGFKECYQIVHELPEPVPAIFHNDVVTVVNEYFELGTMTKLVNKIEQHLETRPPDYEALDADVIDTSMFPLTRNKIERVSSAEDEDYEDDDDVDDDEEDST